MSTPSRICLNQLQSTSIINKMPIIFPLHPAPGASAGPFNEDALLWNLRNGGWPFSLVIQVPEEPGRTARGTIGVQDFYS